MNRNELEQLFGNALNDAEILHMAKNWNEWDVNQYLIDTGYNADCKDVIGSLRREARSIAAAAMGSTRSERKARTSAENGKRGGKTLYNRAHHRMDKMNFSQAEMDFIFADWPEGDEHYRWLLTASREEIADWINI